MRALNLARRSAVTARTAARQPDESDPGDGPGVLGKTRHLRLFRGGDRQVNHALHRIASVRMSAPALRLQRG